ncbi:MAG: hypothetical protein HRU04_25435 [Oceanospirillaceae bacterium]|nr:hypothetical protein [Oceanospirillaceae bacterium]
MRKFNLFINGLLLTTCLAVPVHSVAAEEENEPLFIVSHCMKVKSQNYLSVEKDMWLPMHQELVNQGKKNNWALYRVLYGDRSNCDYYVIESYIGEEQLSEAHDSLGEIFKKVHPGQNIEEAMEKTESSRDMAATSLWVNIDTVGIKPHTFVTVNWMNAKEPDKYISLERNIWKPIHQELSDKGHIAGWGLYALASPRGSLQGYNFATVDSSNRLGPLPIEKVLKSVYPNKNISDIFAETSAVRDDVYSQTWIKIANTVQANP